MKAKLTKVIGALLITVLFGSQAVANSQIKEDFAYAFGSSEGLDSGSITLLSPQEMDETEGLFLGWLIRLGTPAARATIKVFRIIGTKVKNLAKHPKVKVWIRYDDRSHSKTGGFDTKALRWGSNNYYRDKEIQNIVLRNFNEKLHNVRIPLKTWRTNDPGHLHIKKLPPKNPGSNPPGPSPSALALYNRDDNPILSPELHRGEGGVISAIDWETITAEDLLTGKYDETLLTEAARGPKGTKWGMEELTEKQALLGLSILAFVVDPENNADIDIPLEKVWEHLRMSIHLRKNPRKRDRAARMAKLGLKQLEYIINQHKQDYHPSGKAPTPVALTAASETTPVPSTYLPIQAHWWMHEFSSR